MEVWLIVLLIFLVVLVAITFLAVLKHSVYGKFEFPAPPELLGDEEKAFIENSELVSKLYQFINKE